MSFKYRNFAQIVLVLPFLLLIIASLQAPKNLQPANIRGGYSQWAAPDWSHPLGSDGYGYDAWEEVGIAVKNTARLFGWPILLFVVMGIVLGVVLGNASGWLIKTMNSLFNVMNSFPLLMLVILVIILIDGFFDSVTGFQKSKYTLIFYSLVASTKLASEIRGRIEVLRNEDFVESAVAIGLSTPVIILKHILFYYCLNIIISQTLHFINQLLFLEVTLCYLKLMGSAGFMTFGQWFTNSYASLNLAWTFDKWQVLIPSIIIMYLVMLFTLSAKKVARHASQ